jgi:hypothetical protein
MKHTFRLALALCALGVAAPAAAQQRHTLGLGISFTPVDIDDPAVVPTVEIYVPILIAPQFRLEPSLGIFTNDQDGGGVDRSNVTVGIGAFYVSSIAPAADMYVGGRLKLNFAGRDDGVNDDSDTDFLVAAALGGEYYLAPQLSLGLEAQLGMYQRGDISGDDSGFFTNGLAFLRLYF